MTNERPPWFPFDVLDFASDGKVEAMSTTAVGAYTLLLCKAWREDPAGTIPDDDEILARWSRLSLADWSEIKPKVLAAFKLHSDGRWHQKRMKLEYEKCLVIMARRSSAGKSAAKSRWATREESASSMRSAYDSHTNRNSVAYESYAIDKDIGDRQGERQTQQPLLQQLTWPESIAWIRDFLQRQKLVVIPHADIPKNYSLFEAEYWANAMVACGGLLTLEIMEREFGVIATKFRDGLVQRPLPRGWRAFIKGWMLRTLTSERRYVTNGSRPAQHVNGGPRKISSKPEDRQAFIDQADLVEDGT